MFSWAVLKNELLQIRLTDTNQSVTADPCRREWKIFLSTLSEGRSACKDEPLLSHDREICQVAASQQLPGGGGAVFSGCVSESLRALTTLLLLGICSHVQMGTFGPGCLKRCNCVHADGCQASSGECHCLPGWGGKSWRVAERAASPATTPASHFKSPLIYTSDELDEIQSLWEQLGKGFRHF